MKRREFFQAAGAAGAAIGLGGAAEAAASSGPFKLGYAPHFGMFQNLAGEGLVAQLEFAADQGFRDWEDNGMKGRPVGEQQAIAKGMERLGIRMGVFVASASFGEPLFTSNDKAMEERVLEDVRASVEVAQRVNAKWMTVVPGTVNQRIEPGYQTAYCVDLLRRCCEILEPHEIVMVLEPLNSWRDHPGLFLTKVPQAYDICRAVDSPSCKILFDLYHQQIQEGNLIPNIDLAWSEVAYFQCGDNPGRNEPGTGEVNYRNVFRHLHSKGFEGVMGMEHGNSQGGEAGDQAVIDAYRAADSF
ncbi:MAG: hydroxypyruvate isomerase family protein [Lacipirellulaceae bacterium]